MSDRIQNSPDKPKEKSDSPGNNGASHQEEPGKDRTGPAIIGIKGSFKSALTNEHQATKPNESRQIFAHEKNRIEQTVPQGALGNVTIQSRQRPDEIQMMADTIAIHNLITHDDSWFSAFRIADINGVNRILQTKSQAEREMIRQMYKDKYNNVSIEDNVQQNHTGRADYVQFLSILNRQDGNIVNQNSWRILHALIEQRDPLGRSHRLIEKDIRDTVSSMTEGQVLEMNNVFRQLSEQYHLGIEGKMHEAVMNDPRLSQDTKETVRFALYGDLTLRRDKVPQSHHSEEGLRKMIATALSEKNLDKFEELMASIPAEARKRFRSDGGSQQIKTAFSGKDLRHAEDYANFGKLTAKTQIEDNTGRLINNEPGIELAIKGMSDEERRLYKQGRELAHTFTPYGEKSLEGEVETLTYYKDLHQALTKAATGLTGSINDTNLAKWEAMITNQQSPVRSIIDRMNDHIHLYGLSDNQPRMLEELRKIEPTEQDDYRKNKSIIDEYVRKHFTGSNLTDAQSILKRVENGQTPQSDVAGILRRLNPQTASGADICAVLNDVEKAFKEEPGLRERVAHPSSREDIKLAKEFNEAAHHLLGYNLTAQLLNNGRVPIQMRLPLYADMANNDIEGVCQEVLRATPEEKVQLNNNQFRERALSFLSDPREKQIITNVIKQGEIRPADTIYSKVIAWGGSSDISQEIQKLPPPDLAKCQQDYALKYGQSLDANLWNKLSAGDTDKTQRVFNKVVTVEEQANLARDEILKTLNGFGASLVAALGCSATGDQAIAANNALVQAGSEANRATESHLEQGASNRKRILDNLEYLHKQFAGIFRSDRLESVDPLSLPLGQRGLHQVFRTAELVISKQLDEERRTAQGPTENALSDLKAVLSQQVGNTIEAQLAKQAVLKTLSSLYKVVQQIPAEKLVDLQKNMAQVSKAIELAQQATDNHIESKATAAEYAAMAAMGAAAIATGGIESPLLFTLAAGFSGAAANVITRATIEGANYDNSLSNTGGHAGIGAAGGILNGLLSPVKIAAALNIGQTAAKEVAEAAMSDVVATLERQGISELLLSTEVKPAVQATMQKEAQIAIQKAIANGADKIDKPALNRLTESLIKTIKPVDGSDLTNTQKAYLSSAIGKALEKNLQDKPKVVARRFILQQASNTINTIAGAGAGGGTSAIEGLRNIDPKLSAGDNAAQIATQALAGTGSGAVGALALGLAMHGASRAARKIFKEKQPAEGGIGTAEGSPADLGNAERPHEEGPTLAERVRAVMTERQRPLTAHEQDIVSRLHVGNGTIVFEKITKEDLEALAVVHRTVPIKKITINDLTEINVLGAAERAVVLKNLRESLPISLNLSNCRGLTDELLEHVSNIESLRHLDLSNNPQISNEGLAHLTVLLNLQSLHLDGTAITNNGLEHIRTLCLRRGRNLQELSLRDTGITAKDINHTWPDRLERDTGYSPGIIYLSNGEAIMNESEFWQNKRSHSRHRIDVNKGGITLREPTQFDLESLAHPDVAPSVKYVTIKSLIELPESRRAALLEKLCKLPNLEHLDLSQCRGLNDASLEQIGKLKNIKRLTLLDAGVTDQGLAHLANLENLEMLNLCSNQSITNNGLAHLANLKNLKNLHLSLNKSITDDGIAHLRSLNSLDTMHLEGTGITVDGLHSLKNLPKLEFLILTDTKITKADIDSVWKADTNSPQNDNLQKRPRKIHIGSEKTGIEILVTRQVDTLRLPPEMEQLLDDLNKGKQITREDLNKLIDENVAGSIKSLSIKNLSRIESDKRAAFLANLSRLRNLEHLDLSGCAELNDTLLSEIGNIQSLKRLDLSKPRIEIDAQGHINVINNRITDEGLASLSNLKQLEELKLRNQTLLANAQGELPNLAKLTSLKRLDLSFAVTVSDSALSSLRTLKNLESLSLRGNRFVTDGGLNHLAQLTNLHNLNLDGTRVTANGLPAIQKLSKLKELSLHGTGITKENIAPIWQNGGQPEVILLSGNHGRSIVIRKASNQHADADALARIRDDADDIDKGYKIDDLEDHGPPIPEDEIANLFDRARTRNAAQKLKESRGQLDFTDPDLIAGPEFLLTLEHNPTLAQQVKSVTIKDLSELAPVDRERVLASLAKLPNLTGLTLKNCKELTDELLTHVGNIKSLERLDLSGNPSITNAGLIHLEGHPKLWKLNLNGTGVTKNGLASINKIRLQDLDVRNTTITMLDIKNAIMSTPSIRCGVDSPGLGSTHDIALDQSSPWWHISDPITYFRQQLNENKGHLVLKGKITDNDIILLTEVAKQEKTAIKSIVIKDPSIVTEKGMARLAELTSLEHLHISSRHINDNSLAHIENLVNLKKLELPNSEVTNAGLKRLEKLRQLEHLNLSNTRLAGDDLGPLSKLGSLKHLELDGTGITNDALQHLQGLTRLQELALNNTLIDNAGLAHLSANPNLAKSLQKIFLNSTQITDDGLQHLNGFANLKWLSVANTGVTDNGLAHLTGLKELTALNLKYTAVKGPGLAQLNVLKKLASLNLSGTQIDANGLGCLKGLTGLKELSLSRNRKLRAGLEQLAGLNQLRYLHLFETGINDTGINDSGLANLPTLPKLKHLSLNDTPITDTGLGSLNKQKLPKLQILDIRDIDAITEPGISKALQNNADDLAIYHSRRQKPGVDISGQIHFDDIDWALWEAEYGSKSGHPTPPTNDSSGPQPHGLGYGDDADAVMQQSADIFRKSLAEELKDKDGHVEFNEHNLSWLKVSQLTKPELAPQVKSLKFKDVTPMAPGQYIRVLAGFGNLPNLASIDFTNCKGFVNEFLEAVSEIRSLQQINLSGNKEITRDGLTPLAKLPNLKELDLRGTKITEADIDSVWPNPQNRPAIIHLDNGGEGLGGTPGGIGPDNPLPSVSKPPHDPSGGKSGGESPSEGPKGNGGEQHRDTADQARTAETTPRSVSGAPAEAPVLKTDPKIIAGWRKQLSENSGRLTLDNPTDDELLDLVVHLGDTVRSLEITRPITVDDSLVNEILPEQPQSLEELFNLDDVETKAAEQAVNAINKARASNAFDRQLAYVRGLKNLQSLDLSGVIITDSGLAQLAGLGNLQHLNLGIINLDITDAGLAHLKGLGKLQHLELMSDEVTDTGIAHLKGLSQLEYLDLISDHITDTGLAHLKQLTELKHINFSSPHITDMGLNHLKGLGKLEHLALRGTDITNTGLAHLKGLKDLQHLDLGYTKITDAGLIQLKDLSNIKVLNLDGTEVTGTGLAHLKGLKNLSDLDLQSTKITDTQLSQLKDLISLQHLNLQETKITDAGLTHIKDLTNIKVLELDKTEVTESALVYLTGLKNLLHLNFPSSEITDTGLRHLKVLKSLQKLDLSKAKITDAGLVHLKNLNNLEHLSLFSTNITDAGLANLKDLKGLQHLSLQKTKITDAGLSYLKDLTNMKVLELDETGLTGAGLKHLKNLSDLTELFLAGTHISNSSLHHLANLPQLTHVDLTGTKVTRKGIKRVWPDAAKRPKINLGE